MDPKFDGIEHIRELSRHMTEWLANYQKISTFAPRVREIRDQLNWQEAVLTNCPPEAAGYMGSGLGTPTVNEWAYLTAAIPMLPSIDANLVASATGYMASASNSVYGHLTTAGTLNTGAVLTYVNFYTESFQKLQQAHQRTDAVRALVARLGGCAVDRFEKAIAAVNQAQLETGSESAAASEIRTLLHGVQGELMEKARSLSKENKTPWDTTATILGKSEEDRKTLTKEGSTHKALTEKLSQISKDRGGILPPLATLWTQVLEHLYAVLSLAL
jgi:hypothetical protein